MNPGHEVGSPATGDTPPPPPAVAETAANEKTPAPAAAPGAPAVLRWIAASGPDPWFPSAHARDNGVPRDSLDEPLNELRLAGLVRVAAWVKGAGQGYALTPEGEAAAKDPRFAERYRPGVPIRPLAPPGPPPRAVLSSHPAAAVTASEVRPPVVTPVIVVANVLWFLVALTYAIQHRAPLGSFLARGDVEIMHRLGAVSALDLLAGQWWRLMSSCFVHFGAVHLAMNMVALGSMGALAELLWGRWRTLVIYLFAGLGGSCLAMAIYPMDTATGATPVLAGASGAICGVLLALLMWMLLYREYILRPIADELMRRLGLALLLTAGISMFRGVSWEGHLGGAVAGLVTAVLLNAMRFGTRPQRWAGAVGLACVPVVCVGGLLAAMDSNRGWAQLRAWYSGEKWADVVVKPVRPATDAETRLKAAQAALDDYEKNVKPLLDSLSPAAVSSVETEAEIVLIRSIRKKPESAAAVRAKVERLRAAAADAAKRLSVPPTAVDVIDALRARSLAFAAARLRSFDLLLGLLAADAPDPKAEETWNAARAEAHRLWFEIGGK